MNAPSQWGYRSNQLFRFLKRGDKTAEAAAKSGASFSRLLGGIFGRDALDDEFWEELEEALIISDVGMDTTMDLVGRVRARVDDEGISEPAAVRGALREEISATLNSANASTDVDGDVKVIYLVTGVNGAGKTTSIAKLAHAAKSEGKSVLLAAADTFRAGAIEQIQIWGGRLDIDVIAHQAGGDPGAVAYDAIKAAKSRNVDVLFIDTAGRLQTSHNLMAELEKVGRVVEREAGDYEQRGILVLDATTGQNGLIQAKSFGAAVRCDGVVLTKLDSTAKGGIVLAIAGDLKLPVWYIGTGETLEDISTFDPEAFARTLVPDAAPEA